jgi:hypothetical protein
MSHRRKLVGVSVALTFSILMAPFVIAVALGWAARRSDGIRLGHNQFRVSAPMRGRLSGETSDAPRIEHELDAIRARFESQPAWPLSGARGERR